MISPWRFTECEMLFKSVSYQHVHAVYANIPVFNQQQRESDRFLSFYYRSRANVTQQCGFAVFVWIASCRFCWKYDCLLICEELEETVQKKVQPFNRSWPTSLEDSAGSASPKSVFWDRERQQSRLNWNMYHALNYDKASNRHQDSNRYATANNSWKASRYAGSALTSLQFLTQLWLVVLYSHRKPFYFIRF